MNIKDYDGWTPLHAAAHWGKEEACRILVENQCDMDLINKMVGDWTRAAVLSARGSHNLKTRFLPKWPVCVGFDSL